MNFKTFFSEAIRIQYASEDEPELEEEARLLMRTVGVRPNSQKELLMVAVDTTTEQVVGALYAGWSHGSGLGELEGQQVMMFSWDIGVEPKVQNTGIGKQLIQKAMKTYDMDKHQYDDQTMLYIHAINPVLAAHLVKAYGMEEIGKQGNESILIKVG